MARSLDGAVVAVVGATGGLGAPICDALVQRGAVVLRAGRSTVLDADHDTGRDADVNPRIDIRLDIRDADAGDRLVELARARHGRLDGVVDAAGIVAFGDLADTDDAVIEELFLTNVLGPLWLLKRVAPALAETKGFFVGISGVVAESPMPGMAAYSASKAAFAAAAAALRRELRRRGVHVLDARPPHTETGLATRPIAGTAPKLPTGLAPAAVAERIVAGIEADEPELPSTAFS